MLGLVFFFGLSAQGQELSLKAKWETPADFKEPESVLIDRERQVVYVSNINDPSGGEDGNGSIGRLNLKGEVMEVEWVLGGMDAPKGLGLHNGMLYTADLTQIAVIDVEKGELVKTISVEGAKMLNDITVDEQGVVYVSDSQGKKIYTLKGDKASLWLEHEDLQAPNGVLAHKGKLYMVDMGSGVFYEIDKSSKEMKPLAKGLQGGDGIVAYQEDFIISNWNGEIWQVKKMGMLRFC